MPTKYCPHCGKRTGFQVMFNIVCRIGDEEEKGYLVPERKVAVFQVSGGR